MLRRQTRLAFACVVTTSVVVLAGTALPAMGQSFDCDDPFANPVWVAQNCPPPGNQGDPPDTGTGAGERRCLYRGEVEVDCDEHGTWVGNVSGPFHMAAGSSVTDFVQNRGISYPTEWVTGAVLLEGCWRSPWSNGAGVPPPTELGADAQGGWYTLTCLGASAGSIDVSYHGIWLGGGVVPDPEEIALSLLASIQLSAPDIRLSPPATGSVLLRMPLWLSTVETDHTWGPIPDSQCVGGVCVEITAQAVSISWDMGDGTTVTCQRDQNVAWQPGLDFLDPGNACHHYYQRSSRDQPDGRYQVVATTTFRSEWSATGAVTQSGVFENITDFCGPAGNAPCQSTVAVLVEELQVLTGRR